MNDYLDILLGRAKEYTESIQPRLPSIFEPPLESGPSSLKLQLDESIVGTRTGQDAHQKAINDPKQASIRANPGAGHEPVSDRSLHPQALVTLYEQHANLTVASPSSSPDRRSQPAIPKKDGSHPGRKSLEARQDSSVAQSNETELARESSPVILRAGLVEPEPLRSETKTPAEESKPTTAQIVSGVLQKQLLATSMPVSLPPVEDNMQSTISNPTPRVTVHIGRIDIRVARQPNAVPTRKSPALQRKPVMSLDHYLREHNKAKR